MGIDTSAALVWGATYDEIMDALPVEQRREAEMVGLGEFRFGEDGLLWRVCPFYDCADAEAIFGVYIAGSPDYTPNRLDAGKVSEEAIRLAGLKFKRMTGLDGALYLSPHII